MIQMAEKRVVDGGGGGGVIYIGGGVGVKRMECLCV